MTKLLLPGLLIAGVSLLAQAQTPTIEFTLIVNDGAGGVQELRVGLDPAASDTLDPGLGEEELPPPPPFGIFDARLIGYDIGLDLGQGVVRDYRAGDSTTLGTVLHELTYQVGTGTGITVSSHLPPTINVRLQDIITGTIVDTTLHGQESFTVANPGALSKLKLTVTYALGRVAAPDLASPIDNATGVDGSPTLIWRSVVGAADYRLLVAHDSLFGLNVVDTTIADTLFTLPLLEPLSEYWWRVAATGVSGEGPFSAAWKFTTMEWLGAGQDMIPRELKLEQNYPNPFNPSTTIRYSLPIRSYVTLAVFDALGREIATLANGPEEAGFHEVRFEASQLASGILLCRLNAGVSVQTRRMVLMH